MVGIVYLFVMLCTLPLLLIVVIASIFFVYKFIATKRKEYLFRVGMLWAIPFGLYAVGSFILWCNSPVNVDRDRIIGTYEVDEDFYPGPNADWQKEHFRFEITSSNNFILYVRLADNTERRYIGQVTWADEINDKWSVDIDEPYKIVNKYPTLYRSNFSYYYVLETKDFGNMFFRKSVW